MEGDASHTIQFSTGSYMTTVVPLLKLWQSLVGQEIDPADVGGLEVLVESVLVGTDRKGTTTDTIVKVVVDGETTTITLYDTTLKMRIQGKEKQVEYTTNVLIPFLEENVKMNKKKSKELNEMILASKPKTESDDDEPESDDDLDESNAIMMSVTPDRKKNKTRHACNNCDKVFTDKPRLKAHQGTFHRISTSMRAKPRRSRASRRLAGRTPQPALMNDQQQ